MKKIVIAIDIDGVLRNFVKALNVAWNNAHPDNKVIEPVHKDFKLDKIYPCGKAIYDFVWFTHAKECLYNAEPFEGAIKFIMNLKRDDRELVLMTSQPTPFAKLYTMNWITSMKLHYYVDDIVILSGGDDNLHKGSIPGCAILVDDYIKNLEQAESSRIIPICFAQDWNESWNGFRVDNYTELIDMIERCENVIRKKFK